MFDPTNKIWTVASCGKPVHPEYLGFLNNSFQMTESSVVAIFTSIKKLKICRGISECNLALESPNVLKVLHCSNYCKDQKISYHSTTCNTFISTKQHQSSNVCYCKKIMKLNFDNNSETGKENISEKVKSDSDTCRKNVTVLSYITNNPLPTKQFPVSPNQNGDDNVVDSSKVLMSESDHFDLQTILDSIIPDCPPRMLAFLQSQQRAMNTSKNGRRWNKDIIRMCLSLWCRSPRGYKDLRDSGFMVLPSQQLLQIYLKKFTKSQVLTKTSCTGCCQRQSVKTYLLKDMMVG